MIVRKATFTGKDAALETGKEYTLHISTSGNGYSMVVVKRGDLPRQVVPYESVQAFLNNWDNVHKLEEDKK
jgi:hypothetical protein